MPSPALLFAFSGSSSVGTLPVNMKCAEKLGVPKSVSAFFLPLGATINMNGTVIYHGVERLFDMGRTVINITGDTPAALFVSVRRGRSART